MNKARNRNRASAVTGMIFVCLVLAINARATLPVVDYAGNIANEINWVINYIKQVDMDVQQHLIVLKEVQQIENEIEQLERMGNPGALTQLPGVSNIQTLSQIIAGFKQDVAQLEALVNPHTAANTANQVLQTYGQPLWNGFTAANGTKISPNVGMIQFSASDYNVINAVQQNVQNLQQKKLTLSQQRDQAISAMQSANDQSTIFKQSAIIQALSGAISDVNAQITQAVQAGQAQQQKNQAAREISAATQIQRQNAADLGAVDQDMNLPWQGRQLTLWPQ